MNNEALIYMIKRYEEKLREYMNEAEYDQFVISVAQGAFKVSVDTLEDEDFKAFCQQNMDAIFGGE